MRNIIRLTSVGFAVTVLLVISAGAASAQDGDPSNPDAYVGGNTTIPTTPDTQPPSDTPSGSEVSGSEVSGSEVSGSEVSGSEVKSATLSNSESSAAAGSVEGSTLAFTGGDVLMLAGIGAGAIAVGGFVLVTRRKPQNA